MNSALQEAVNGFLFARAEEEEHKKRKERYRDALRTIAMDSGREDENGSRIIDFDAVTVGGKSYRGISAQRRISASIDLDKVEALLRKKGETDSFGDSERLYNAVFKKVTTRVFDEDALYALNQRGIITDDELDSLITETVTFAIVPVR